MPRKPSDHHFAADLPAELWKQFETWAKGRGKLSNPQIGAAFLKIFLAAPEPVKIIALAGRLDQSLAEAFMEAFRDIAAALLRKTVGEGGTNVDQADGTSLSATTATKDDALRIIRLVDQIQIETPEDSAAWAGLAKQAGLSNEEIGKRMAEQALQIQRARQHKKVDSA